MKTTVNIPDRLFRELKVRAAREGVPMRVVIDAALREYLTKERPGTFKLKDGSVGGSGYVEGIRPGDWEQLRDIIYEGRRA